MARYVSTWNGNSVYLRRHCVQLTMTIIGSDRSCRSCIGSSCCTVPTFKNSCNSPRSWMFISHGPGAWNRLRQSGWVKLPTFAAFQESAYKTYTVWSVNLYFGFRTISQISFCHTDTLYPVEPDTLNASGPIALCQPDIRHITYVICI